MSAPWVCVPLKSWNQMTHGHPHFLFHVDFHWVPAFYLSNPGHP